MTEYKYTKEEYEETLKRKELYLSEVNDAKEKILELAAQIALQQEKIEYYEDRLEVVNEYLHDYIEKDR